MTGMAGKGPAALARLDQGRTGVKSIDSMGSSIEDMINASTPSGGKDIDTCGTLPPLNDVTGYSRTPTSKLRRQRPEVVEPEGLGDIQDCRSPAVSSAATPQGPRVSAMPLVKLERQNASFGSSKQKRAEDSNRPKSPSSSDPGSVPAKLCQTPGSPPRSGTMPVRAERRRKTSPARWQTEPEPPQEEEDTFGEPEEEHVTSDVHDTTDLVLMEGLVDGESQILGERAERRRTTYGNTDRQTFEEDLRVRASGVEGAGRPSVQSERRTFEDDGRQTFEGERPSSCNRSSYSSNVEVEKGDVDEDARSEIASVRRQRRTSIKALYEKSSGLYEQRLKQQYIMQSDMVAMVRSQMDPERGGNCMVELITSLRLYAQELLSCDRSSLFIKVKKGDKYVFWTMLDDGQEFTVPLHSGLVGAVLEERTPVRIKDAYEDARFNFEVDRFTGYRTKSVLCVPVFAGPEGECDNTSNSRWDESPPSPSRAPPYPRTGRHEDILGVLQALNKVDKSTGQIIAFDCEDENALRSLASMAAITILVTKALEAERRAKDRFAALGAMAKMLLQRSTADVRSLYRHIQSEAARLCQCEHALIYMLDGSKAVLQVESPAGDQLTMRLPPTWLGEGKEGGKGANFIAGYVVRTGATVNIIDAQTDEVWSNCLEARRLDLHELHSMVALPIEREGLEGGREIMGVLQAINKRDGKGRTLAFDSEDIELLEGLCVYTASAVATNVAFAATASSYKTVELQPDHGRKSERWSEPPACTASGGKFGINSTKETPTKPPDESAVERPPDIRCERHVLSETDLLSWDFNAIGRKNVQLSRMLLPAFHAFCLPQDFAISDDTVSGFAHEVSERYFSNPYHSYAHAWTVLQACMHMVCELGDLANSIFAKVDVLALFVAALCHDLGHPGTNNSFQQKICSPLAMLYNDESILENHHAASCFQMLCTVPGANILAGLTKAEFRVVRRFVCSSILSTDMSRHERDLARLRARVSNPLSKSNEEDRQLAVASVLHCADLSNPARSPHLAEAWARLLAQEFILQTQQEEAAGVEVSTFMRSGYQEANEVFFIQTFVKPVWETLACMMPPLKLYVSNINSLLELLKKRIEDKEAANRVGDEGATMSFQNLVAEEPPRLDDEKCMMARTVSALPELSEAAKRVRRHFRQPTIHRTVAPLESLSQASSAARARAEIDFAADGRSIELVLDDSSLQSLSPAPTGKPAPLVSTRPLPGSAMVASAVASQVVDRRSDRRVMATPRSLAAELATEFPQPINLGSLPPVTARAPVDRLMRHGRRMPSRGAGGPR